MSNVKFRLLSSLPDSILARILSFLPARDAARTMLLKTFGNLWSTIDILDFDDGPFHDGYNDTWSFIVSATTKFFRFVRYFIMLHQRSKIRKFRVSISYTLDFLEILKPHDELIEEVEIWIKFAISRGVEVLDLGVGVFEPNGEKFRIPDFVWNSDCLNEIRLLNCDVRFPKRVNMGVLKILTLNAVEISDEVFDKVISCCPVLQDLDITDCDNLNQLRFTATNIKNLRVSMSDRRWKLSVNCPKVRSFHFSGYVECMEIINLSSVKIVASGLKIVASNKLKLLCHYKRFLNMIQHAEVLILDGVSFAVLSFFVMENHPCPRNKWKRVVLHGWLNSILIRGVRSLLRYSCFLEELIIHIRGPSDYSHKGVNFELANGDYKYKQFVEDDWSFQCLKQSLKSITMHGLLQSSYHAQFDLVRIILKNGLVLEKVVIFDEGNAESQEEIGFTCQELVEIAKRLRTLQKVSKHTSLHLIKCHNR